jgi:hypothetical protein
MEMNGAGTALSHKPKAQRVQVGRRPGDRGL